MHTQLAESGAGYIHVKISVQKYRRRVKSINTQSVLGCMHAGCGGGAVLAAAAVSAPLGWLLVGCQHAVVLVPHELQCRWPGRGGGGGGGGGSEASQTQALNTCTVHVYRRHRDGWPCWEQG